MFDARIKPFRQVFVNDINCSYDPQGITTFILCSCLFKSRKLFEKEYGKASIYYICTV